MREDTVKRFCNAEDLCTYDPYDIWQTRLGFQVKRLFNRNRYLGLPAAGVLTVFDKFINNEARCFYQPKEYAVVRALAALSLLNCYEMHPDEQCLSSARRHLDWLLDHSCQGYSGYCWGLGFRHTVSRLIEHDANTPYSTMTPYPLEGFVRYAALTRDTAYDSVISSIMHFFDLDISIMEETPEWMATSYGPCKDRMVVNASSYAMYAYALGLYHLRDKAPAHWRERILKMYNFVKNQQREDGSWLYSPEGKSFIDCFHSCIVLKNLIKTSRLQRLEGCVEIVDRGYEYLKNNFLDSRYHLYRRFSLSNKPSIVKFDLYDNAELLLVAALLGDHAEVHALSTSIGERFCQGDDIFSEIDLLGIRRNKNMLRWAVMPYLHAISSVH